MKYILMLLPFTLAAHANCPNPLSIDGEIHCLNIEWLVADRLVRGQPEPTNQISPVLNPMRARQRILSNAKIQVWRKGDPQQRLVTPPGLRVFPYMLMQNGHHHGTAHVWDEQIYHYNLSEMGFTRMPGCWQLRVTLTGSLDFQGSEPVYNLTGFTNLNETQREQIEADCSAH